ncbi:MAG: dihydroorotate dehydrogenase-like protein [Isosphaeraceae bacterium]|nr:dihydroorotate dehydrogenase-like protein [Isosphaeraceae bacterium]
MSVDLSTRYLGLDLPHPLVVSACPLSGTVDGLLELQAAGAAAAVLPSLFEEQIEHDQMALHDFYESTSEKFPEAASLFPELDDYRTGPEQYLELVAQAKRAVSMPIIASLNGVSRGGWIDYARKIQDAGADALELNIYFIAVDPDDDAAAVERRYLDLVEAVRAAVTLPLAVKLGPYFSSLPNMARKLVAAGADGLVLFNRFLQPDIELETLRVVPRLVLSRGDELRLPLRWTAILRPQLPAVSIAATSGVHSPGDVVKLMLVGADVAMVASSIYKHGAHYLTTLREGLRHWLAEHEYDSIAQMKGSSSRINAADPAAFERANYVKTLVEFSPTSAEWRV